MRRLSVLLLSAAIAATLAMPAQAQWKWRGTGGQIQYSDTPPPAGTPEQDILQRPNTPQRRAAAAAASAASAASGVTAAKVEPELEAKRKKAEQEEAAKKKAEDEKIAATRAENCSRAKSYLRTLDDGIRIARTNDKGEREILDDKQRADETKRARETIASDCK
ncbi:MAG: DUF4124 domain-containing protein [Burkholderiales bacterium]|jgi:opacity protein-like surface antigen|nr:DUF4124 domain-containing protein [Burkholderiales bacterium]